MQLHETVGNGSYPSTKFSLMVSHEYS